MLSGNQKQRFLSHFEGKDSANACYKLKYCHGSNVRKRRQTLVGGNKCTWGPGYWCANLNNAEECGEGVSIRVQALYLKC